MGDRKTECDHSSIEVVIETRCLFVLSLTTKETLCVNDDLRVIITPPEFWCNISDGHIDTMSTFGRRSSKLALKTIIQQSAFS